MTFCYDGKIGAPWDGDGACSWATGGTNVHRQLTEVRSSVSKTQYTSFDAFGRVLSSTQITTGGGSYPFGYSYNRAGLVEMTYPSGRVVRMDYDPGGRLSGVSLKKPATGYVEPLGIFTYNAANAPMRIDFGNGAYQTVSYNSRLQATGSNVYRQSPSLAWLHGAMWGYRAAGQNNGDVSSHDMGFVAGWKSQRFTYDGLSRLRLTQEGPYSAEPNPLPWVDWEQRYAYDRYGNRALVDPVNTMISGDASGSTAMIPKVSQDTVAAVEAIFPSKNRWNGSGVSHDNAGNMTALPNRAMSYDGESRLLSATMPGMGAISYAYDGEGRRVKKTVGSNVTIYVYNAFGELTAEYSTVAPAELGTIGVLAEDAGMFGMGPTGERLYGDRNCMELLSVFDTPPLLSVFWGPRDLGSVHPISVVRRDNSPAVLSLGGRSWEVTHVDTTKNIAYVVPAEKGGRSRWLGESAPLSFALCQMVRRVLLGDGDGARWSKRAVSTIEELRTDCPWIDDAGTVLLSCPRKGTNTWWTFSGLKAGTQFAADVPGNVLRVDSFFLEIVDSGAIHTWRKNPSPATEGAPKNQSPNVKFVDCLPAAHARRLLDERRRDYQAVQHLRTVRVIERTIDTAPE